MKCLKQVKGWSWVQSVPVFVSKFNFSKNFSTTHDSTRRDLFEQFRLIILKHDNVVRVYMSCSQFLGDIIRTNKR